MILIIGEFNPVFRYTLINIIIFNFKGVIFYNFFRIKKYNGEDNIINIILSNDKLTKL